jgi:hypothetical protein
MVSELPLLIKSSQVNVRMLALKIVQESPGSVPVAVLREMLDDPDPTLALPQPRYLSSVLRYLFSTTDRHLESLLRIPL